MLPVVRAFISAAAALLLCGGNLAAEPAGLPQTVRCAAVGGLNDIDFWPQLADRFQRATGHKVEFVAVGPKQAIAAALTSGEADVVLMHSSDTMINLVADGYGENPQPWAKNDFVIVGPASDPAKIRGEKDAVAALKRIIESRSKLLLHASNGANELVSDLLAAGELELDPATTISLPGDKQRQMLKRAAAEQAYTLVGRIPFLSGKLETSELLIMVQGDERLRRPFLVVTATKKAGEKSSADRLTAARRFAAYLREPTTQEFIAGFGKGRYDDRPLLFPVVVPR
ncbi:MAG TPA: substrate-binding domain-containing protein [Pirellulaceae bacterium]|jgi:tungstate transport system substrate-binding protein